MSGHRPPSRLRRSPRTEKRRARYTFEPGRFGTRLMAALGPHACLFTLTVRELDRDASDDPDGLYDRATLDALAGAARRRFRGPCWVVFEVGRNGRLHVHVIAHRHDGPEHIPRESQRCKWVHDGPGLVAYLNKADPYSLEAEISLQVARLLSPSGRTPNTRRPLWGRKRLAWLETNALSKTTHYGPLPPVLACGRCRGRHLPFSCPNYQAAAAALSRNEAGNDLTDTALEVLGFRPVAPAGTGSRPPNLFRAAAAGSLPPSVLRRVQVRQFHRKKRPDTPNARAFRERILASGTGQTC